MNLLNLNDEQYKTLKKNYLKALEDNKTTFPLWEENIDTNYAKRILEAIEEHRIEKGQKNIPNPVYTQSHACPKRKTPYTWESRKPNPKRCPNCKNVLNRLG